MNVQSNTQFEKNRNCQLNNLEKICVTGRTFFSGNSNYICNKTTSRETKNKIVFNSLSKIYILPEDVTLLLTVIGRTFFSVFSKNDFIILQCTNYVSKPRINRF